MRIPATLLVAGLLVAAAAPSGAHSPGQHVGGPNFIVHQHYDDNLMEDGFTGMTCGFSTSHDDTGVIVQDPTKQTGWVQCGPVAVANTAGGTSTSVTISGCFKVNDDTYGGGVCRFATVSGNVGVLSDTISFNVAAGDDLYYCTSVSWTSSKGGGSFNYDADESTPGEQCALSTSIEA